MDCNEKVRMAGCTVHVGPNYRSRTFVKEGNSESLGRVVCWGGASMNSHRQREEIAVSRLWGSIQSVPRVKSGLVKAENTSFSLEHGGKSTGTVYGILA